MLRIAVSEFFVYGNVSFIHSALVGGPFGFSSDFTGVDDAVAWRARPPFSESVHNLYNLSAFPVYIGLYCYSSENLSSR